MWIAQITEISADGKHRISVTNTMSGEVLDTRVDSYSPTLKVLPPTFFSAIQHCLREFENKQSSCEQPHTQNSDDFQGSIPHIEDDYVPVSDWNDITEDFSVSLDSD